MDLCLSCITGITEDEVHAETVIPSAITRFGCFDHRDCIPCGCIVFTISVFQILRKVGMKKRIVSIGFISFLVGMLGICMITPDRSVSESERRKLAQFPSVTVQSILDTLKEKLGAVLR